MAKRKLTFYFDILSPFAYLAYYMTRVGRKTPSFVLHI